MSQVVFADFAQGDVRSVVLRLTPRLTNAPAPTNPLLVVAGSWKLVQSPCGSPVQSGASPTSGTLCIDTEPGPPSQGVYYSFIATEPITWMVAGQYVMRFRLLWSDNTQDNTLCASIPVDTPCV